MSNRSTRSAGGRILSQARTQDARRAKALARYPRIVTEFGDVGGGRMFDTVAQAKLQIRRLTTVRPGLPAVPTAGPDALGNPMAQADYAGKVVVLAVRSPGCAPFPGRTEEVKALSAKYAKRGVAFVGVYGGLTDANARKAMADDGLPWRGWLDVYRSPKEVGPIAEAWCTDGMPALILIDRKGVIRHTQVHEYFLPQDLDKLLAEQPGVGF